MLVWNITLRTLQNGEADILLDDITWCKKQHSESINNGVDIELFFVLPKKSVVCDVQGYGCVLQEC
jgi:hypothetical protein